MHSVLQRRSSTTGPNVQYQRLSFGDRQTMMESQAFRTVVAQASVNNTKLRQMSSQKQVGHSAPTANLLYLWRLQVLQAGLGHRKLANGNILPGVVDAARRLLASAKNAAAAHQQMAGVDHRVSTSEVPLRPPDPYLHVHLTQRHLQAPVGSRVRGVEMLPSVDVPNIPSSEVPATVPVAGRRHRSPRKSYSVLQLGTGDLEQEQQQLNGNWETLPAGQQRLVRPDLFRKKDSPQEAAAKAARSPQQQQQQKQMAKSKSLSMSTASATSTNTASTAPINDGRGSPSTSGSRVS
jgi:hypothetical protein